MTASASASGTAAVAVPGTGIMGAAMARGLRRAAGQGHGAEDMAASCFAGVDGPPERPAT